MADAWAERRTLIATEYAVDVKGIQADTNQLMGLVRSPTLPPVGAIDISKGTSVASSKKPLVPDLEDFAFDALRSDSRLKVRQIENNFEEGLKYLHECAALRSQFSDIAKDYVDTTLRAEEFFRLDAIHQMEIEAGLYEMPFSDAADEYTANAASLSSLRAIKALIAELFATAEFSDPKVKEYLGWSRELGMATASPSGNPTIGNWNEHIPNYRLAIEKRSWNYSLQSNSAAESQMEGKLKTASRHRDYLQKDVTFRKARTLVSRDVAYAGLAEHIRPNSPLHYSQRLTTIKQHYAVAAARLAARIRAISQGCQSLYGISLGLPVSKKGEFLDECLTWMSDAQEKLSLKRTSERMAIYTVWLSDTDFFNKLKLGIIKRISVSDTGGREGLLRGVACEYMSNPQRPLRPIRLNIEPPKDATADLSSGGVLPESLRFGRVLSTQSAAPLAPNFSDIMWNGSPYGEWRIQGFQDADGLELQEIALHFWIAHP